MAAYANPSAPSMPTPGAGLPSDPLTPDLRNYYLNFGNPDAGFWNFLGGRGLGGPNDLQSKYAQNQQGRYSSQYGAQAADHPGLGFYDYLQQQTNPQQDFANAPDALKGYAPSNVMAPRGRWILR